MGRRVSMLPVIVRGRPAAAAAAAFCNNVRRSLQFLYGVEGSLFVGWRRSPSTLGNSDLPVLRLQRRTPLPPNLLSRQQNKADMHVFTLSASKTARRERAFSTCSQGGDSGDTTTSSQSATSDSTGRSRGSKAREQSGNRGGTFHHQRRSHGGSSSGFIRMVLSQVKEDLEKNPELRKAVDELKSSAISQKTQSMSSRIHQLASLAAEKALAAAEVTQSQTGRVLRHFRGVEDSLRTAHAKFLRQASRYEACRVLGKHTQKAKLSAAAAAAALQAVAAKAASVFQEEPQAQKKVAQWRQRMAIQRYQQQQRQAASSDAQGEKSGEAAPSSSSSTEKDFEFDQGAKETALVLSQETAWDRFGSKLRDMPFLQSFYENPLVGQLFKETEIAASIREMKSLDPSFKLSELHELVQTVIAEHIVQAFLLGDEESLKLHCGEGAFAALRASIEERRKLRLRLDPSILMLGSVELVGAKRSGVEGSSPWFIYSFECQQINCLRAFDSDEVKQGSQNDIRRVVYSFALARHEAPETPDLLYPWVVKEIAIVGNEAVW